MICDHSFDTMKESQRTCGQRNHKVTNLEKNVHSPTGFKWLLEAADWSVTPLATICH